jgi:hypothetical protein
MNTHISNAIRSVSLMLMLFLMGGLVFLSSCQKEDPTAPLEAKAPPVIERVRLIDPAKADSSLQSSTLGTTIVIVGQNLAATQHVTFNGLVTPVNPVYATETHLIVTIPSNTPTVATAANVPNELKVVNAKGEATYTFTILPPAPIVEGVSNEYAKAGEEITLYGQFFYFIEKVTFPGGVEVAGSNVTTSADGNTLKVIVPEGVDASQGDIIVTSASGSSAANRRSKLFNSHGMIIDWDTLNESGSILNFGWGIDPSKAVTTSAKGITGIDERFGMIDMAIPANWGWSNDKVVSINNWNTGKILPNTPAEKYQPTDPIANFDLKMEMAASGGSLEGLRLQVWVPGTPAGDVEVLVPLTNFVRSTDGKWYTVTVPLADLAKSGTKLAKFSDLNPGEMRLVIQNSTAADIPATIAIDNIRIVNHTK